MAERLTITMSPELAAEVRLEAKRRRLSVSEYVRSQLSEHRRAGRRRRLPFESLGRSGIPDLATRMDEILREELPRAVMGDS